MTDARHDAEEFVARFEKAAPALLAWASLRLGPALRKRLDPEDLVQETCCRAFEGRRSFDPEKGAFRGWLFGIAHNVLRHALRRLATGPREASVALSAESRDLIAALPGDATSISSRAARSEEYQRLLAQADQLSEEDRKLLALRGLIGLEHTDVASRLGLTVANAEKRWQRLRDRLAGTGRLPTFLSG